MVFKGKSPSEVRNSPKLRAHATSVFYVLTSYVENVDDPETLVGLIQKIAASHIGRGITVKEFEVPSVSSMYFLTNYFSRFQSAIKLKRIILTEAFHSEF